MDNQRAQLQIVKDDPYLTPHQATFYRLRDKMDAVISNFSGEGGLDAVSKSYQVYGLHEVQGQPNTYLYKEWAPAAQDITIFGDFNNWNRNEFHAVKVLSSPMQNEFGHW